MASHKKVTLAVQGMTCASCEVLIESRFKSLPGVFAVRADAHRGTVRVAYYGEEPSPERLQETLRGTRYRIGEGQASQFSCPSFGRLLGVFVIAFGIGLVFIKLGLANSMSSVSGSVGIGVAFIVGLVAAASSCVATVGGLMITAVAQYQRTIVHASAHHRALPVGAFILGRIVSYAILGGVLGALGAAFSPSPAVTGIIVVIAALYMIIMGLDMVGIAPPLLKRMMPRMPKAFMRTMVSTSMEQRRGLLPSFLMGAVTFFIPCGFTQSLQIYALTTGSFLTSALILGAFALGTTPTLGILGLSLSSVNGKAREFVFQCAGALVLLMGAWNVQNGLTIAGHPLNTSWLQTTRPAQVQTQGLKQDAYVYYDGTEQIVRMNADYRGYTPKQFTIRAGVPTRWQIDGTKAYGCVAAFQVPQLGIRRMLEPGINELRFVAPQTGQYVFSCSMGMYRGIMNVVPQS